MDKHTQRRPIKPMEYEEQKASESKKAHELSGKSRQLHAPVIEPHPHPQAQPPKTKAKKPFWKRASAPRGNAGRDAMQGVKSSLLRTAIMLGASLLIVVVLGFGVYTFAYKHYIAPVDPNSTEEITVVIGKNDSLKAISKKLQEAGVIRNSTIFKYYVDFSDMSTKLLAGKFTLSPSMTYDDIINVLKRPSVAQTSTRVTLVEGILIKEMIPKLENEGVLDAGSSKFSDAVTSGANYSKYWFIQEVLDKEAPQSEHRTYMLEGYLFPDTYDFYISSDPDAVVTKMLDRFHEIYTEDYKKRAQELGMSTDEVVILASIIEKEAGKTEDFAKVSAVFHNRLNKNMKLQSCATHQYFMTEKKFTYNAEELKIASPYNTYQNDGLPIGPICNPGKAAIEAALWPNEQFLAEGYLYFCAGDPAEGTTVFAKTYEEHQANVAKYSPLWK